MNIVGPYSNAHSKTDEGFIYSPLEERLKLDSDEEDVKFEEDGEVSEPCQIETKKEENVSEVHQTELNKIISTMTFTCFKELGKVKDLEEKAWVLNSKIWQKWVYEAVPFLSIGSATKMHSLVNAYISSSSTNSGQNIIEKVNKNKENLIENFHEIYEALSAFIKFAQEETAFLGEIWNARNTDRWLGYKCSYGIETRFNELETCVKNKMMAITEEDIDTYRFANNEIEKTLTPLMERYKSIEELTVLSKEDQLFFNNGIRKLQEILSLFAGQENSKIDENISNWITEMRYLKKMSDSLIEIHEKMSLLGYFYDGKIQIFKTTIEKHEHSLKTEQENYNRVIESVVNLDQSGIKYISKYFNPEIQKFKDVIAVNMAKLSILFSNFKKKSYPDDSSVDQNLYFEKSAFRKKGIDLMVKMAKEAEEVKSSSLKRHIIKASLNNKLLSQEKEAFQEGKKEYLNALRKDTEHAQSLIRILSGMRDDIEEAYSSYIQKTLSSKKSRNES